MRTIVIILIGLVSLFSYGVLFGVICDRFMPEDPA